MKEQLQLHNAVADLQRAMHDAWSTASDYEVELCSYPSQSELHGDRLLHQVRGLYVRVGFLLEALQLPELLAEFKRGFERFRRAREIVLAVDEFGNPYPLALEYLATFVAPLVAATSDAAESLDELPRLERILQGTARLLKDRGIEPCKETDVRNALFQTRTGFRRPIASGSRAAGTTSAPNVTPTCRPLLYSSCYPGCVADVPSA